MKWYTRAARELKAADDQIRDLKAQLKAAIERKQQIIRGTVNECVKDAENTSEQTRPRYHRRPEIVGHHRGPRSSFAFPKRPRT